MATGGFRCLKGAHSLRSKRGEDNKDKWREAKIFEHWLKSLKDPKMFRIAHISYGCNPGDRLMGNILEDERVWAL